MTNKKTLTEAAAVLGRKGGQVKSEAKARAARDNGKKGGRPRKSVSNERRNIKMKITIQEWEHIMNEQVEGTVFISCIMDSVPHHPGTKRYQIYNEEGSYDEIYDITIDDDGYIINIE